MGYELETRLIWCLSGSGLGTTISGNGNSGPWYEPQGDLPAGPRSAVSLAAVSDIQIMVSVAGKTSTPTFAVQFGYFDDLGNLYQPSGLAIPSTAFTASAPLTATLSIGRHSGSAGTYVVFPEWGQIAWTCTGGSMTGVEICVYGQ